MYRYFLILLFYTLHFFANGQILEGKITDENNEYLIGANIVIKGSKYI